MILHVRAEKNRTTNPEPPSISSPRDEGLSAWQHVRFHLIAHTAQLRLISWAVQRQCSVVSSILQEIEREREREHSRT